jgi:hypothetical protein
MFFKGNQITTTGLIATPLGNWAFSALGYLYWDNAQELGPNSGSERRQQSHDLSARRQLFGRFGNINMNVA